MQNSKELLEKKEIIYKFSLAILLGNVLNPKEYFPQAKTYQDVIRLVFDSSPAQVSDIFILDDFQTKLDGFLADLWVDLGSDYYTAERTKKFLQSSLNRQG